MKAKTFNEILEESHNRVYNNPLVRGHRTVPEQVDPRDELIAKQAKKIDELKEDIFEITGGKGVFNHAVHNSIKSR